MNSRTLPRNPGGPGERVRYQRVIIASDEPAAARADWWAMEIPRAWPRPGEHVACCRTSIEDLLSDPSQMEGSPTGRLTPIVVLALGGDGPRSSFLQAVDRLLSLRSPALVLAADPDTLRPELEPHGLIVESLSADRIAITRVLHALTARQPALDTVAGELRVARASQGGLSGEIGRLHDELQLAGAVQRRFLPKQLPDIEGYEFGVLFRPCGYVSGDIYDIVRLDESRIAFVLADAVGHGVPAALLTLVLGRALRVAEPLHGGRHPLHSPAETLARLNADLCIENEAGDRFATGVCGVIDTASNTVTISSAGHPAPLVLGPGRSSRAVEGGEGPLLGVFQEAIYTEITLELAPGQTLLFYTDGFETAFPGPDADPGRTAANLAYIDRFTDTFAERDGTPGESQRALEQVAAEIDTHAGSLHQRDDLTAVALRRLPTVASLVLPAATRAAAA